MGIITDSQREILQAVESRTIEIEDSEVGEMVEEKPLSRGREKSETGRKRNSRSFEKYLTTVGMERSFTLIVNGLYSDNNELQARAKRIQELLLEKKDNGTITRKEQELLSRIESEVKRQGFSIKKTGVSKKTWQRLGLGIHGTDRRRMTEEMRRSLSVLRTTPYRGDDVA